MNTIIKKSNLKPTSFDTGFKGLTKSQKNIVDLIVTKLNQNKPITRDDIVDIYLNSANGVRKHFSCVQKQDGSYGWEMRPCTKDNCSVRIKAMQWFKLNMGSCIIKGKILAIPVIEID